MFTAQAVTALISGKRTGMSAHPYAIAIRIGLTFPSVLDCNLNPCWIGFLILVGLTVQSNGRSVRAHATVSELSPLMVRGSFSKTPLPVNRVTISNL
jgi:hypothetical protein